MSGKIAGRQGDWKPSRRLKKDGTLLAFESDETKASKDDVLAAVGQNGIALQYASAELRNNKDVALVAVRRNPKAFSFVNEELRSDIDVQLAFELGVLEYS